MNNMIWETTYYCQCGVSCYFNYLNPTVCYEQLCENYVKQSKG